MSRASEWRSSYVPAWIHLRIVSCLCHCHKQMFSYFKSFLELPSAVPSGAGVGSGLGEQPSHLLIFICRPLPFSRPLSFPFPLPLPLAIAELSLCLDMGRKKVG